MTKRKNNWVTESHELLDGDCKILKTNQNGDVYQLHVWVQEEGKMYRRSLRTKHLETAIEKGKEEFYKIRARSDQGKKIFSDDVTTVAGKFLDWKYEDVKSGTIVKQRHSTINTHIKHMLSYLHGDMKVSDIHRGTFLDYYNWRRKENSKTT